MKIFWVPHKKSENLQASRPVRQARQMQYQNVAQKSKQRTDESQGLPYLQWETDAWYPFLIRSIFFAPRFWKHTAIRHCLLTQISVKKHSLLSSLPHNLQAPVYQMDLQLPVKPVKGTFILTYPVKKDQKWKHCRNALCNQSCESCTKYTQKYA